MTTHNAIPPQIAVIGCGHWGKNHVRNFHALGALAAVTDANADLARTMSETYGVPIKDYADILADPAISGVVIAAPAEAHGALATQALDAGKHVFVEKPLALTVAEAEDVAPFQRTTEVAMARCGTALCVASATTRK